MIEIELELLQFDLDDDYIENQLDQFGQRTVERIRSEMRRTPKTGKVYKRGGKRHVASSPGGFPAIDTGYLSGQLDHEATSKKLVVSSPASYSGYVDAKRPFMEPGVDLTYKDWPNFMSEFIKVKKNK